MKLQIHQFLSKTGLFSSKELIIRAIKKGEITLDGKIVKNPKFDLNPKKRKVFYNKKNIDMLIDDIYIIINKPQGYLSSKITESDIQMSKKSVFELIKINEELNELQKNSLFCVGRLDEDTSGLLVLTNDGKIGHRITNPNSNIKKKYYVELKNELSDEDIKNIESGISIKLRIEDNTVYHDAKPAIIEKIESYNYYITLTEGKKHEVKKIFEAVDNQVLELKRTSIGEVNIKDLELEIGEYKFLEREFIMKYIFDE
ncbi:rRNA pseudouridine synthase [archaeon]|jgi:16S rRNA pseudouridine516 synthase|nr:rRNA pseudouridine synthase [archaeon]MBT4647449.1 rRNA pseudouridine synthase [archaeon]MBT6822400.1 rRNA pseudouridine synthase [archaeon]MBT7391869.1 rRNA pseudouridine synthase [archaeon]